MDGIWRVLLADMAQLLSNFKCHNKLSLNFSKVAYFKWFYFARLTLLMLVNIGRPHLGNMLTSAANNAIEKRYMRLFFYS